VGDAAHRAGAETTTRPPPSSLLFSVIQLPQPFSPIHPSPLPGGRLGGGCGAPSGAEATTRPPTATPAPPRRHPRALRIVPVFPSFPLFSVISALLRHSCAGRNPRDPQVPYPPQHPDGPPAVAQERRRASGGESSPRTRWVPACAGMTVVRSGCRRAVGKHSRPPTPHLTSPLRGGRDEFSWGSLLGGCCLVRWGGAEVGGFLPAQE